MSFIAAAIIGGGSALGAGASIFGSLEQVGAEKAAAGTIQSTTNTGVSDIQSFLSQYFPYLQSYTGKGASEAQKYFGASAGALAPYADIGTSGGSNSIISTLQKLLTPGQASSTLSQLPGFQFTQGWGENAVNNAATTSGLGGNVLTAADQYTTGLAQSNYSSYLSQLLQTLGIGGTASGGISSAATSTGGTLAALLGSAGSTALGAGTSAGSSIASLISGAGQNIAQTQVGAGNAIAGGATGVAGSLGSLTNLALLSKLIGGSSGGMFGGGPGPAGGALNFSGPGSGGYSGVGGWS